jgi:hypothetical protein
MRAARRREPKRGKDSTGGRLADQYEFPDYII